MKAAEVDGRPDWTSERRRKCPCCSPLITDLFICALWLNKCHSVSHFFIHIIYNCETFYHMTSEQNEYIMGIIYSLNNNNDVKQFSTAVMMCFNDVKINNSLV